DLGIFLDSIGKPIISELKKYYEVIEDLDFRKASVVDGKVFFGDFDSSQLDGYLWFSFMHKDSDSHDMLILEQLEKTIPVINPTKGLKIGLDKFKTLSFLKANGIPVPEFALIESGDEENARKIIKEWGSVLAKPRYGGFGIGIFKADDADELLDLMDFAELDCVYVERFYENNMDDWCGVNVVGGKVLYGYGKETSKIKGYKVFDRKAEGGKMILRPPNPEQQKIALETAKKTGMDFFGVDIIKAKKDGRYLVVDMNTFPGVYPEMMDPNEIANEFARMVKLRLG
ncbi:hypothetical protein KJ780_02555, partial [Candidatus Micrarchaeota archaeon]|nr:hypothetical protein [Candidatus Micrarchaeota archaeon]